MGQVPCRPNVDRAIIVYGVLKIYDPKIFTFQREVEANHQEPEVLDNRMKAKEFGDKADFD